MGIRIIRASSYLPDTIVENQYFEDHLNTTSKWIYQRTGIRTRRFAKEDTSDLVLKAVEGLDIEEYRDRIDLVLVASFTSNSLMPNMASLVQEKLNLKEDILAMDFNMACTGFVAGLYLAEKLLEESRCGLVIGGEKISKYLDMEDRKTSILFGDGAGVVLLEKDRSASHYVKGNIANLDALSLNSRDGHIMMNGQEVFKFASKSFIRVLDQLLEAYNFKLEDIDHIVSHQANFRIFEHVAKMTKSDLNLFHNNLYKYGNTSSASIPILIDELLESEKIKKGSRVLIIGFGAGLAYMGTIIEW